MAGAFGPFPQPPVHPDPSSCAAWLDGFLMIGTIALAVAAISGVMYMFSMDYLSDRHAQRG